MPNSALSAIKPQTVIVGSLSAWLYALCVGS